MQSIRISTSQNRRTAARGLHLRPFFTPRALLPPTPFLLLHPLLLLAILSFPFSRAQAADDEIAVLVQNLASPRHAPLVHDLSNILATTLRQGRNSTLLEPTRLENTLAELGLDLATPISAPEAARLGTALQTDRLVAASFSVSAYQIDARLLDARSGKLLTQQSIKGTKSEVLDLVDALGDRLAPGLRSADDPMRTVAVLYFENLAAPEYDLFVRGLADILKTSLQQEETWSIVERPHLEKAMRHFALEAGRPLSLRQAGALGHWLGADAVVTGSFAEVYQFDVKLIDAKMEKPPVEQSVHGKKDEIRDQVSALGARLSASLGALSQAPKKVAVLYFENHTSAQYERFVRGISDMLMTSLGQSDQLQLIERLQIDRAMDNFNLELSGPIDTEAAVEVGEWLGADAVVLGSFIRFGEVYRIDARLIEARTGALLIAQNAKGSESDVISMVDQLGARLVARFDEKETQVEGGSGHLQIRFKISKTEMGERPVYYHICKLYVDGKFLGMSPVVQEAEAWVTLYSKRLRGGRHDIEIIHGYAKDGDWDGEIPEQPRIHTVTIQPGATSTLKYSFEVGWFSDSYQYEYPWRGLPR